jgi:RNA polymerase sigma-70 factor (ECF subfamily)
MHDSPDCRRRQREEALRRAILAGEEAAWRALYDESFEALLAYIRWRLSGAGTATDEIVQETWLVAVRRIRDFVPAQGSFLNWLRGIAANLIRNWLCKRRPLESIEGLDLLVQTSTRDDCDERIAHALDALSARHEAVLRAKYLEGLSVAAIAATWGESEKAIESLLSRARAAFRQAYGPLEKNEHIQALE